MKSEDRPKLEIAEAVAALKERKKVLEKREKELASKETQFDRAGVEGLAKRRFFYAPAFSIYGGQADALSRMYLTISHTFVENSQSQGFFFFISRLGSTLDVFGICTLYLPPPLEFWH